MTRPWWRHPVLGLLAVLAVVLGVANILLSFSETGRLRDQQFVLLHLLTMVASGYLLIGWVLPFAIGRERADTDQRVAQVLASGPMLASAWCSARVGTVSFRGPLLRVSVYPGGIVLQPLLIASRAILVSELRAVEDVSRVLGGLRSDSVQLKHTAPDVRARVQLHIDKQSQLAAAIRSLLPA